MLLFVCLSAFMTAPLWLYICPAQVAQLNLSCSICPAQFALLNLPCSICPALFCPALVVKITFTPWPLIISACTPHWECHPKQHIISQHKLAHKLKHVHKQPQTQHFHAFDYHKTSGAISSADFVSGGCDYRSWYLHAAVCL